MHEVEDQTEFERGYVTALTDVGEWLDNVVKEWRGLKIVDDRQALALRDLVHEYQIMKLYEYKGV